MKALSLFSGAGIGEFYLHNIGIDVVVGNEINTTRAKTHEFFYPQCQMIADDIIKQDTQAALIKAGKANKVNLIIATPPCQGLSTAGSNKTETSLFTDPRNHLVLSALKIVDGLEPDYFIIENVPRFQQMKFELGNQDFTLLQLLLHKYNDKYEIACNEVNAADYCVPQTRCRVVYRMWKKGLQWSLPERQKHITLHEAIGDLPSLEAGQQSNLKNHNARIHPTNQIDCMKHTPPGQTAFSNERFFPKRADGIRIKGYNNSYKRMRWNLPAPTITMRNEIISSQENVHPGRDNGDGTWSDARVLTLRELLIVSSLPPDLDAPNHLSETAFRQLIGEGIPPLLMKGIMKGIV